MKLWKVFLLVSGLLLLVSLFFAWVVIESKSIVVSGMDTTGTAYGKPGLLSLFFDVLVLVFAFVPRVWAHRICIFSSALNAGWAWRNFLLLSACSGGECPQRQPSFYIYLISSFLVLVAVLLQEVPYKKSNGVEDTPL